MSEMLKFPTLLKNGIVTGKTGMFITARNGEEFSSVESAIAELWSNGTIFANVPCKDTGVLAYRNINPNSVDFN
jgi:hypothetical protein